MAIKRERKCIVQFEQNITPRKVPPRLQGLARRIACSALTQTLTDIEAEAKRIEHGASRIPSLNRFSERKRTGAVAGPEEGKGQDIDADDQAHRQRNCHKHAEMAAAPAGSISAASYSRSASRRAKGTCVRASSAADALPAVCQMAGPCRPVQETGLWHASLANRICI